MKILILGSEGLLGSDLVRVFKKAKHEILDWNSKKDISKKGNYETYPC